MARNAEKSMTTLARWRASQVGGVPQKARRPFLASECDDLRQSEKWRNQIISEVARKVSQIQNAGLGEFRIRDLNDEINKLLREKGHWEVRIKELGGQDYARIGPKVTDMDGQEAPGNRGYIYFGAAKDLPGVRELFEQEPPPAVHKTRGDLMKEVDAEYYGYRDEEDGLLIPLEVKAQKKAIRNAVLEYKKRKLKTMGETADSNVIMEDDEEEIDDDDEMTMELLNERSEVLRFMSHVPNIPTQGDIERAMVDKRKKELLQQFLGDFDVDDSDDNDEIVEMDNVKKEKVKKENVEEENVEMQNLQKDNVETENVETENVETENVETENVETENVEKDNVETENVETENVETENVEMKNVEMKNVQKDNVETENVEKDNVETENVETENVEMKNVEMKNVQKDNIETENVEMDVEISKEDEPVPVPVEK